MAKPDPSVSDWSDLDLLTKDEASDRIDAEIVATTEQLRDLPAGPEREQAQHRLDLLTKVRARHGETG